MKKNPASSVSSDTLTIRPIGHIHTDFPEKFGIPRQSGLVPSLQAYITFEKEFQNPDCFRGIERFTHLWLIWGFSENQGKAGHRPSVRRGWAEMYTPAYSLPARRFAPIPWDFLLCGWKGFR